MRHGNTFKRFSSLNSLSILRFKSVKTKTSHSLGSTGKRDRILCQVTSKHYSGSKSVKFSNDDFQTGSLRSTSYARPGKLFTANESVIVAEVGKLKAQPLNAIVKAIVELLENAT